MVKKDILEYEPREVRLEHKLREGGCLIKEDISEYELYISEY